VTDAVDVLKTSLAEQLAALRGVEVDELPAPLLDVAVYPVELPGGEVYIVRPRDWEALRDEEGMAPGRPLPYWGRLWPSASMLAHELAANPPGPGTRVIELGCGLGLPSIVAARGGAAVLATDGHSDAVAFAAHSLALNEQEATVVTADIARDADALVERGPFDLVLGSDVLYERHSVALLLELLPRLAPEAWIADPGRPAAEAFLDQAVRRWTVETHVDGVVHLHRIRMA
jgi:predicted nicotinamide N-methyase